MYPWKERSRHNGVVPAGYEKLYIVLIRMFIYLWLKYTVQICQKFEQPLNKIWKYLIITYGNLILTEVFIKAAQWAWLLKLVILIIHSWFIRNPAVRRIKMPFIHEVSLWALYISFFLPPYNPGEFWFQNPVSTNQPYTGWRQSRP